MNTIINVFQALNKAITKTERRINRKNRQKKINDMVEKLYETGPEIVKKEAK